MTAHTQLPPADPWAQGVRASDVPIYRPSAEPSFQDPANSLVPNRTDISAHLYALFEPAFVQAHPEAWIEIAYAKPDGKLNAAENFSAFDLEKATAFAEAKNKAGHNVYVGAALRHGAKPNSGRANGDHVLDASHAWAEYDGIGDDERIQAILKANNLVPPLVVTTGTVPCPRRHLYFKLDGAVAPEKLEAANTALFKLLGSDAVHDAPRVMRLAGTVNYPKPDKQAKGYVAELVTLHTRPSVRAYQTDALIGLAPTKAATPNGSNHGESGRRDDGELVRLLEASRTEWHKNMLLAIASMVGRGWRDDAIKISCAPYCEGGADDPDLVPLIQGARGKWDKPGDTSGTAAAEFLSLGEWDAGEDLELPPPRGWLLGSVFCRQFVSSLLGDGGVGKTALRYAQLVSLAIGRSLTGEHVFLRCRVLIVSMEDGVDELRRRIRAVLIHHGIELSELEGWLFLAAPGAAAGKLMALDQRGRPAIGGLAAKLAHTIATRRIDIVSLDPFVKTHSVEENNNSAIDDVIQILSDLSIKHDMAVDIPHHMSKGTPEPGNANRGRGASAAKDGGRLVYTLTPMSAEEAKTFALSEVERRRLIRMDNGKVNIAAHRGKATWFRLVGIPLGNGTKLYPNGDEVQTVVPWQPPETWSGLSNEHLNATLTDIEAGMPNGQRYSDAARAPTRAAWPIIQRHCPDRTEAQCREIIKAWVKNGVLYNDDYDDPVDRKPRKGLRLDPSKRPG